VSRIAIYGLGEAGSLIGSDLVAAMQSDKGVTTIKAYDPADVPTPDGIVRTTTPAEAVSDADVVLSLTGSVDARTAIDQAAGSIAPGAVYADFASASAGLKRELAEVAGKSGFAFVDVALMAMVPGNGVRTPSMFAGSGSDTLRELLQPIGMPIDVVSQQPGDAAERKLLRSVVIKGLAGLLIESLEAAHIAGCPDWLWENLVTEFTNMDGQMLERLVKGTAIHAGRRFHEMEASAEQLKELGVTPVMTASTVENLAKVKATGVVPEIP